MDPVQPNTEICYSQTFARKEFAEVVSKNDGKAERKAKLKIVWRRLPSVLTEDVLIETSASYVNSFDFCRFVTAPKSLGENSFSRMYIYFKTSEDALNFGQSFRDHLFRDSKGNEYVSVVEYAPYQRFPKPRRKDPRANTIESDADYLKFVATLSEGGESRPADKESEKKLDTSTTPLLEYLKAKRTSKHRDKLCRRSGQVKGARLGDLKTIVEKEEPDSPYWKPGCSTSNQNALDGIGSSRKSAEQQQNALRGKACDRPGEKESSRYVRSSLYHAQGRDSHQPASCVSRTREGEFFKAQSMQASLVLPPQRSSRACDRRK
ncbi:regulator of nonsense transcripts 3A-like isoform X1 [Zophobas morio]|uniref:regulator of nonsense transcripts 3A-like isoform X1 n=1 Tax=Zophobas morio TaxID=2755281 RepID=UPI00308355FD